LQCRRSPRTQAAPSFQARRLHRTGLMAPAVMLVQSSSYQLGQSSSYTAATDTLSCTCPVAIGGAAAVGKPTAPGGSGGGGVKPPCPPSDSETKSPSVCPLSCAYCVAIA